MNVIVVMLDSLRRDHLGCYGNPWIRTPQIDRFAARSTVFDNAYFGSYPCLPARRDIWTGRYEFPFRGWGGLESGDQELPGLLSRVNIKPGCQLPDLGGQENARISMLILDNWLLLSPDGNYHRSFAGWEFIRGQEGDRWITDPGIPIDFPCEPTKLRWAYPEIAQHLRNTAHRRAESDYFAPRVMQTAMDWLDRNNGSRDFLLWIDGFDPHEPWDPPQPYIDLYDPGYDGEAVFSPRYGNADYLSTAELKHAHARYAGEITMVDRWVGRLFDKIEHLNLMENTLVVMLSDHGFLFGEHGLVGKPWAALSDSNLYDELARIPFIAYLPGATTNGSRLSTLVQPVDIFPTILEAVGLPAPAQVDLHGVSVLPLLRGTTTNLRSYAFFGRYREAINVTDGAWTLFRWPDGDPRTALYHNVEDPQQGQNLVGAAPEQAQRLTDACDDWLSRIGAPDELRAHHWSIPTRFP